MQSYQGCLFRVYWSLLCLAPVGLCSAQIAPAELRLRTAELPPYQVLIEGKLSGVSVATLNCALNQYNVSYQIDVVPTKRAEYDVRQGVADGYFSAVKNQQSDVYARLSAPLALEKWFLVSLGTEAVPDVRLLRDFRIGVLRGSSESEWLQGRVSQVAEANSIDQLTQLLAARRVDALVADQRALASVALQQPEQAIRMQFLRYAQLGVYFRHDFLQQRPNFLRNFNQGLGHCQRLTVQLTEVEKHHLQQRAAAYFELLLAQTTIFSELEQAAPEYDAIALQTIDERWQAEYKSGAYTLIADYLSRPLSRSLAQLALATDDGVNEILVFDRQGANVAFSRVPSDFNQADEIKFQQTIGAVQGEQSSTIDNGADSYLDDIVYDASTQSFQAQWTRVVRSPEGEAIGAITLGLDVETLLSGVTVPLSILLERE